MNLVECKGEIWMFFFGKKKEEDKNYRKVGLETNYSNYGWYTCVHCGRKFRKGDIDIDHILPQSKGGTNDPRNLQCLCKHCNRSKQADTSRTREDLKNRKTTYAQSQRAPYLKNMIERERQSFREDLPRFSNSEIREMLKDPDAAPLMADIRREARKRGII